MKPVLGSFILHPSEFIILFAPLSFADRLEPSGRHPASLRRRRFARNSFRLAPSHRWRFSGQAWR